MKRLLFLSVLAGVWFIASSKAPSGYDRYDGYAPFFMERTELERSVCIGDAREMENPGKLWIRDDEIFIVERYKGVHIVDNSDPSAPRHTAFIVAPGCMDIAIRDDIAYLDNAVDLVALDLVSGTVTKRLKNFFPAPQAPNGQQYRGDIPDDMILVGWRDVRNQK